ncbi:polyprenyl synthetase family protein [Streptomyces sp. NRRL B-3648]|uniref:polyprenyl synthetase family protein n=1 Tax=Streptomyces sp. NRRL B-3648 TaxID=1519493 RepID=UPI0006AFD1E8|nr:polyprenyl synthetase family protein [Streptomyces sp. NRRL B-3648]KOV89396.1 geranylgeranyl pyrophosphate synthase [Streptomyces sp. NRRL B-3648]
MRPTQAKDHPAAARPRPVATVPGAALPRRPATGGGEGPDGTGACPATCGPLPDGPAGVRRVDADVPGAVGRTLDQVLEERLRRARLADPLFAQDVAERVARFTLQGGKRTRAQLVWWATRACAGRDPAAAAAALRIAAALELLQTCALVQDDVMDRAVLRRGRPTLHTDLTDRYADRAGPERARRFGQSAAVLAGDLALAWADDLVAETPLAAWTGVVVRRLWSDMRTEMVAGQYLDVQGEVTAARSLPRVLRAARLKSALYSVERPLALGAAVAGADDATLRRLCDAGGCVGLAFQLRDDLDDVFGDPGETGKASGGDIREGKPTYLVAVARARAEAAGDGAALAVLDRWLGDPALTGRALDEVREVLVTTGARATVETKIDRLAAQGMRHFDGAALDPEGAGPLRALLLATAGARPGGARPAGEAAARPRPAPDPYAAPARGGAGSGR